MRNKHSRKYDREMHCCCMHGHGGMPIFFGLMLLVIGLALEYRYSLAEVLMLIGGILIVKGLLVMLFRKDKD